MAHYNGWFPTRRDDIIHMAEAWEVQIDLRGQARGIPQEVITRFKTQLSDTKTRFAEVKSAGRNAVNTEQCRLMFRDLGLTMQFIKANYFNSPPRTSDEITALLSFHDGSSTPIFPNDVVPGLTLHNTDGHSIMLKLFMNAVPSDRRSADHFFGKWGLKPAHWTLGNAGGSRRGPASFNPSASPGGGFAHVLFHEPEAARTAVQPGGRAAGGIRNSVLADAPVSGRAVLPHRVVHNCIAICAPDYRLN
jgi:hypothetical protein